MRYKSGLIFICLIICLFSIASVCAGDVNETAVASEDQSDELIGIENQDDGKFAVEKTNDEVIFESDDVDDNLEISQDDVMSATHTVSGNTFVDIQKAINSAKAGDTIILSGNYVGEGSHIKITKKLNIEGDGAVLDAKGASKIFEITGSYVSLNNIEFINGKGDSAGAIDWWSGNNDGPKDSYGVLTNCKFINCQVGAWGGAVYFFDNNLIMRNCYFMNNMAGKGGAVYIGGDNCEIDSCYFVNSECGAKSSPTEVINCKGGAVYIGGANCKIKNSEFTNNYCRLENGKGGAIFVEGINCEIDSCHFENNDPGAIYVINLNCKIKNSEFLNNHYGLNQMDISNETQISITKCTFNFNLKPFEEIRELIQSGKNKIELSGHYIWDGEPLYIAKSVNIVGVGKTIIDGGFNGPFLYISSDNVNISNVNFINGYNRVTGIKSESDFDWKAIYIGGNNVCIQNSNFTNNHGVLCAIYVDGNNVVFKSCIFKDNIVLIEPKRLNPEGGTKSFTDYWGTVTFSLSYNEKNGGIYEIKYYDNDYDTQKADLTTYDYSDSCGALVWLGDNGFLDKCIFSDNFGYRNDYFVTGNNFKVISPYAFSSSDVVMYYGQSKKFTVTLNAGKPVSNVYVKITVKDKTSMVKTNSKGQASVDLKLPVGNYFVVCEYDGVKSIYKVTVKKATPKLTAKKKTFKKSKKTKKYTVTLKDNIGKAMNKVKLTIKVGKKTYKATTNSKGKATFNLKKLTKKGKYTATIKYNGDKNYNKVTKKVKIVVK